MKWRIFSLLVFMSVYGKSSGDETHGQDSSKVKWLLGVGYGISLPGGEFGGEKAFARQAQFFDFQVAAEHQRWTFGLTPMRIAGYVSNLDFAATVTPELKQHGWYTLDEDDKLKIGVFRMRPVWQSFQTSLFIHYKLVDQRKFTVKTGLEFGVLDMMSPSLFYKSDYRADTVWNSNHTSFTYYNLFGVESARSFSFMEGVNLSFEWKITDRCIIGASASGRFSRLKFNDITTFQRNYPFGQRKQFHSPVTTNYAVTDFGISLKYQLYPVAHSVDSVKRNSLYAEILGKSGTGGVFFERRFIRGNRFGLTIGVGSFVPADAIYIPIGVDWAFNKRNTHSFLYTAFSAAPAIISGNFTANPEELRLDLALGWRHHFYLNENDRHRKGMFKISAELVRDPEGFLFEIYPYIGAALGIRI